MEYPSPTTLGIFVRTVSRTMILACWREFRRTCAITCREVYCLFRADPDSKSDISPLEDSDISRWRVQAVSALLTEPKTRDAAERKSAEHLEKLKQNLESWLGDISMQLSELLSSNVIARATNTLDMICRSNKPYAVGSPNILPGPIPEVASSWPVREVSSWKRMSSSSVTGLLHCLYPRLLRLGESGPLLVRPTLLGYKAPELQPPLPLPPPPLPSRSSSPRKQDRRRRERDGSDSTTSRSSQRQSSSSAQLSRTPEVRPQKPKQSGLFGGFGNCLWNNLSGYSGRPERHPTTPKSNSPSSTHQGRHVVPHSPMPEIIPNSQMLYQQEAEYSQSSGSNQPSPHTGDGSTAEPLYNYQWSQPEPYKYEDPENLAVVATGKERAKSNRWRCNGQR